MSRRSQLSVDTCGDLLEKSGNIRPKINEKMSPFPVASGPEGPISMPYIYSTDYQKKYFCILIGCYE